jgi:oxygen-independent coproporphyrinogen-3 oxidase
VKPLAHYYRALEEPRLPTERGWVMTDDDRLRRAIIHQIMCNFHVDLGAIGARFGVDARTELAAELQALREPEREGLIERRGLVVELTPLGRILVRNVAMLFDAYLQRKRADSGGPTFSRTI